MIAFLHRYLYHIAACLGKDAVFMKVQTVIDVLENKIIPIRETPGSIGIDNVYTASCPFPSAG